jgi:opacity protein-like surface antigen
MKMRKIALFLAMGFATSAFAAGDGSMYVAGNVHMNMSGDMHDSSAVIVTSGKDGVEKDTKINFKSGYNAGLALGYRMGDLSFEGEVSKFSSKVDKVETEDSAFRASPADKNTKDISELAGFMFMANAHYSFSGLTESVVPRLGAGIGMTHATLNADNASFNDKGSDDAHTKFAFQVIAGIDMPFDAASVGLEYRYVHMGSNDYMLDSTKTVSQKFNSSVSHNMIGLHVAYNF